MGYTKPKFAPDVKLMIRRREKKTEKISTNSTEMQIDDTHSEETIHTDNIEGPVFLDRTNIQNTATPDHVSKITLGTNSFSNCSVQTDSPEMNDNSVQSDITMHYIASLEVEILSQSSMVAQLRKENAQLKAEIEKLKLS